MAAPFIPQLIPGGKVSDADQPEEHRGQLRFAERFTREYNGRFLHAHGIGWHEYDGARWAECKDGAETRAVIALIKQALQDAAAMDKDARDDLIKDVNRVESAPGKNGVLALAEGMHPCTVNGALLDEKRTLLNTQTGTVDLDTGQGRQPSPADRLSKVTRAAFKPDARSDVFDTFLAKVQPDPEMRSYLARSLGSALLGIVRDQILFIWHGEGANGKGTLRDAVRYALGDYAIEVPAEILLASKYGPGAMAPDRMRLRGTRMAFCSEIDKGARMDVATMKKLTGGDPVNAKLLYRDPIDFDPSHQLFMLTNELPAVPGDDPAVWRRIQAVPFDVVVPPEEWDTKLPEKLKAAPDAILAWIWHGWLDYQQNGLNPPPQVLAATRKYQEASDILARFLDDENGVVLRMGQVKSGELYKAFTTWAKAEGEDVNITNKAFTQQLEKRGFKRAHKSSGAWWQGLSVASHDADEDRPREW